MQTFWVSHCVEPFASYWLLPYMRSICYIMQYWRNSHHHTQNYEFMIYLVPIKSNNNKVYISSIFNFIQLGFFNSLIWYIFLFWSNWASLSCCITWRRFSYLTMTDNLNVIVIKKKFAYVYFPFDRNSTYLDKQILSP